jgi:hypothetical protein
MARSNYRQLVQEVLRCCGLQSQFEHAYDNSCNVDKQIVRAEAPLNNSTDTDRMGAVSPGYRSNKRFQVVIPGSGDCCSHSRTKQLCQLQ